MKQKMKAILLSRVSTPGQDTEAQSNELIRAAEADGYKWVLIENKESAIKLTEEERQGLNDMKALIEKGGIGAVYVWELSRLSRRPEVLYSIREYLQKNRVQLVCMHPDIQMFTPDFKINTNANIVFGLFVSLCENEMALKKDRFKRAKALKLSQGRYIGGGVKYGYRIGDKDRFEIDEDQARTIVEIFDMYIDRGMAVTDIYRELRARGRRLSLTKVKETLKDPAYTGAVMKSPDGVDWRYPAIITEERLQAAAARMAGFRSGPRTRQERIHLASGILRCPVCGRGFTATGRRPAGRLYQCTAATTQSLCIRECDNRAAVTENFLDSLLWNIARKLWQKSMIEETEGEYERLLEECKIISEKIEAVGHNQEDLEKRQARNNELWIEGEIGDEAYERGRKRLKEKLAENKAEGERLHAQMRLKLDRLRVIEGGVDRRKVWDIVRESWRLEDLREMREIVRRYIVRVTLEYVKKGSKDKLITIEQADGRVIRLVKKAYKNIVTYEDGRPYDLTVLELHRY